MRGNAQLNKKSRVKTVSGGRETARESKGETRSAAEGRRMNGEQKNNDRSKRENEIPLHQGRKEDYKQKKKTIPKNAGFPISQCRGSADEIQKLEKKAGGSDWNLSSIRTQRKKYSTPGTERSRSTKGKKASIQTKRSELSRKKKVAKEGEISPECASALGSMPEHEKLGLKEKKRGRV